MQFSPWDFFRVIMMIVRVFNNSINRELHDYHLFIFKTDFITRTCTSGFWAVDRKARALTQRTSSSGVAEGRNS